MSSFSKIPESTKVALKVILFCTVTLVTVFLVQSFVFRIYYVTGSSMETTLSHGELLFVNKLGRSINTILGKDFTPSRGALVVFKNPLLQSHEESTIKRVIGLPGDRVVLHAGQFTIYNQQQPQGFNPDQHLTGLTQPISGEVDRIVPEGELFVAGDNREAHYSLDSRNGLSTIPLRTIEGVVVWRTFPVTKWRLF